MSVFALASRSCPLVFLCGDCSQETWPPESRLPGTNMVSFCGGRAQWELGKGRSHNVDSQRSIWFQEGFKDIFLPAKKDHYTSLASPSSPLSRVDAHGSAPQLHSLSAFHLRGCLSVPINPEHRHLKCCLKSSLVITGLQVNMRSKSIFNRVSRLHRPYSPGK